MVNDEGPGHDEICSMYTNLKFYETELSCHCWSDRVIKSSCRQKFKRKILRDSTESQ